jgi:hypothetical protein
LKTHKPNKEENTMKKTIITNNKKVESAYQGKENVTMLDGAPTVEVLREGLKLAEAGGKLLLDPSRRKNYFKSLVFHFDDSKAPDNKSIALIEKCLKDNTMSAVVKEPVLAGIHQNRDLDLIKSVLA